LIFEIDVVGSEGRLMVLDNCSRLTWSRFEASPRYGGYRELVAQPIDAWPTRERFVPLFVEIADALDGGTGSLTSDGRTALETQVILEGIRHGAQSFVC
jgi:hypothetical protein